MEQDRNRVAKEDIALDEGGFDRSVGQGKEGTFPSQGTLGQGEGRVKGCYIPKLHRWVHSH